MSQSPLHVSLRQKYLIDKEVIKFMQLACLVMRYSPQKIGLCLLHLETFLAPYETPGSAVLVKV